MNKIINQIIENKNYHILSNEQVEVLKQLVKENEELRKQNNQLLYANRKNYKII